MKRRSFLKKSLVGGSAISMGMPFMQMPFLSEQSSDIRITRIRYYQAPKLNPTFNQSNNIVVVETDQGVIGIGEGGTTDPIKQLGSMLIGKDPFRIEHLWQLMYRGYFYPPGREKIHALGALDMALWDIKAKMMEMPVYELLGGKTRDHIECYSTGFPWKGNSKDTAKACMEAGFRAYRISTQGNGKDRPYEPLKSVQATYKLCQEVKEGVGEAGDWAIDFHTRLDISQAVRLSSLIEDLEPYFVEDLLRSENKFQYEIIRQKVNVPIAVGEHFSDRWDIQPLVENDWIDYSRITLPNAGGITEFKKIAAMCETHYVGLIPHFTGPVSTAALVHVCAASPGPVMMEMRGLEPQEEAHLPKCMDFKEGKLLPNDRPGLGVIFDPEKAILLAEINEHNFSIPTFRRKDGSITNW